MTAPRSSLAPFAHLMADPQDADARRLAGEAWRRHGLILINPSWLGWVDRQQATILADKLHGKRQ